MLSKLNRRDQLIERYFRKNKCEFLNADTLTDEQKFEYLNKVFNSHMQNYPFHNFELRTTSKLHPLYRTSLPLFTMDKFIDGLNGGFCFQSSYMLYLLLKRAGFDIHCSIAKILNGLAPNSTEAMIIPATHLVVVVTINNKKYLLDPSMGMNGCCAPFLIPERETIYQQNNLYFKIEKMGNEYMFYRKINDKWSVSLCSSFLPASDATILTQLTKLGSYPLSLGIRDVITLVGIATPDGGMSLRWDPNSRVFIFKKISSLAPDETACFKENEMGTVCELLNKLFKINHIGEDDLKHLCEKNKNWPKPKHSLFINFPIDRNERERLKESLSLGRP